MAFNKINIPDNIRNSRNQFITTAFDDSLTIDMRLRAIFVLLNESVATVNDIVEWINGLDIQMQEQVTELLTQWLNDGTLANLINQTIFNDLQAAVTALQSSVATNTSNISKNASDIAALQQQMGGISSLKTYLMNAVSTRWIEDIPSNPIWEARGWVGQSIALNGSTINTVDALQAIDIYDYFDENSGASQPLTSVTWGQVDGGKLAWYYRPSDIYTSIERSTNITPNAEGWMLRDLFNALNYFPTIIFTMSIHGDEKGSTVAAVQVIDEILYSNDDFYRTLRTNFSFIFIPMINPQGFNRNFRRVNTTSATDPSGGVDINRDFNPDFWTQNTYSGSTVYSTPNGQFVRDVLATVSDPNKYLDNRISANFVGQNFADNMIVMDIHNFAVPTGFVDQRFVWLGTNRRANQPEVHALTSKLLSSNNYKSWAGSMTSQQSNHRATVTNITTSQTIQREAMMNGMQSLLVEAPRVRIADVGYTSPIQSVFASYLTIVNGLATASLLALQNVGNREIHVLRPAELGLRRTDNVWDLARKCPHSTKTIINFISSTSAADAVWPTIPQSPGGSTLQGCLEIDRNMIVGTFGYHAALTLKPWNITTPNIYISNTAGSTIANRPWVVTTVSNAPMATTFDETLIDTDDEEDCVTDDLSVGEESYEMSEFLNYDGTDIQED